MSVIQPVFDVVNLIPQKIPLSHSAYQKFNTCGLNYDLHYNKRLEKEKTNSIMLIGKVFDHVFNEFLLHMWNEKTFNVIQCFEEAWHNKFLSVPRISKNDENDSYKVVKYLCLNIQSSVNRSGVVPFTTIEGKPCVQHANTFDIGKGVLVKTIIDLIGFSKALNKPVVIDVKTCAKSAMASNELIPIMEQLLIYSISCENDPLLNINKMEHGAYWQFERKAKMPTYKTDGVTLRANQKYPEIRDPEIQFLNEFHKSQIPQRYIQTQLDINQGRFFGGSRMAFNSPCKMCDFSGLCTTGNTSGLVKRKPYVPKVFKQAINKAS